MPPPRPVNRPVYDKNLLSSGGDADAAAALHDLLYSLSEELDAVRDARRKDWHEVSKWALIIAVALIVGLGGHLSLQIHNFSSELREKGERLTLLEERLRHFTELPP